MKTNECLKDFWKTILVNGCESGSNDLIEYVRNIEELSDRIRYESLELIWKRKYGYIGSCFSVADILAVLYSYFRLSSLGECEGRDYLVFSKGHAAPALYAAINSQDQGLLTQKEYARPNSPLQGFPNSFTNPLVDATTGSSGNGLAIGVGMAHGLQIQKKRGVVVVVMGDGELQEGLVWEAYIEAMNKSLGNLLIIIDVNEYQSNGTVSTNSLVASIFKATSKCFIEVDGHSVLELLEAIGMFRVCGGPMTVYAHTLRGKGVSAFEEKPIPMAWIPDERIVEDALHALRRKIGKGKGRS